jgi:branched-chain amino acid transport system substrate-binding protein
MNLTLCTFALAFSTFAATARADIVVGQSADLSGGNREQGQQVVAGAQAYFNAVNTQGGVRGQKLKLVVLDDGGKADKAKTSTAELLTQHKASVLFGYTNRVTAEAGMAAAIEAKAVFFAPASGGETLRLTPSRYVFHARAGYAAEYRKIVDTLFATGTRTFGFVVNTDDTKNTNRLAVEEALKLHGLQASVAATLPRNEVNFAEASAAILKANPAVLILAVSGKSVAPLIKDLKAKGYTGRFATISFLISNLPAELGPQAHGLMITNIVPPPTRVVDKLVNDARRDLQTLDAKATLSYAHLEGYMSAKVLVEGLRRASTDNTEALIIALESITRLDLSNNVRVGFSAKSHNGSNFVDIAIVGHDGRLIY